MVMPRSRSEIHRVEHLRFHFAVAKSAAQLNDAVGEGRFTVVDMGDDGKVADMVHKRSAREPAQRSARNVTRLEGW
jgi:hypothetical protein